MPRTGFPEAARRFRWPTVAAAVLVTLVALGCWLAVLGTSRSLHGEGPAGGPVTVTGSAVAPMDLEVYADSDGPVEDCDVTGSGVDFPDLDPGRPTLEHAGTTWHRIGRISSEWRAGDTVTCPRAVGHRILLTVDERGYWLRYAVALSAGAVFLSGWAALVVLAGGRARRGSG